MRDMEGKICDMSEKVMFAHRNHNSEEKISCLAILLK